MKSKLFISALIISLSLFRFNNCFAVSLPPLIIQGKLDSKYIGKKKITVDSVVYILVSKYGFSVLDQQTAGADKYEVKCSTDNTFKIIIPAPSKQFYIKICSKNAGDNLTWIDKVFIVNSGDEISCKLDNKGIIFSGRNKDKMNCQAEILSNTYSSSDPEDIKLQVDHRYEDYLKSSERKLDSCLKKQIGIVNKYKSRLNKDLYQALLANCYGFKYSTIRFFNISLSNLEDVDFLSALRHYYRNYKIKKAPDYITAHHKTMAPIYTNYLLESYKFISKLKEANPKQQPQSIFSEIIKDNEGTLKDKLLTLFCLSFAKNSDSGILIDSALKIVKNPFYLHLLTERHAVFKENASFYKFELQDSVGRFIKLADFKDKVIFIDFYYTGCIGCLSLSQAMPYVLEKFKDNDSVKFITVSIDKNKDLWLKTLRAGKYTHEGEVNLYTNGNGSDHPLIKYYNITSYPTFFLIKDGKIFSSSPPRPGLNESGKPNEGTHALINMIESAWGNSH